MSNPRKKRKREKTIPECPICLEEIDGKRDSAMTRCGHRFHLGCLIKSVETSGGHACPLCRGKIVEEPEIDVDDEEDGDGTAVVPNNEDDGTGAYNSTLRVAEANADALQACHEQMVEAGDVPAMWSWTDDPLGWVETAKLYADFVKIVADHPMYIYHGRNSVGGTPAIDEVVHALHEAIIDNLEMLSCDHLDMYNHPESILVNVVFGPAFCDGFSMHERYILLLKTMNDVMDVPGSSCRTRTTMIHNPVCNVLSGRFTRALIGRPLVADAF